MLSTLITGGTTTIKGQSGASTPPASGRYHGFRLSSGTFTLTMHDSIGTAAAAAANEIDRAVHIASQPTMTGVVPGAAEGIGRQFFSGLQAVLTAGGTATIFYE